MKNLKDQLTRMTDEEVTDTFRIVASENTRRRNNRNKEKMSLYASKSWKARTRGMSREEVSEMMASQSRKKTLDN